MTVIPAGPIKRIHVNQHHIKANRKNGNEDLPVFTVKTSRLNVRGQSVKIIGESETIYSPDKPLSCGARVWVQTTAEVHVGT